MGWGASRWATLVACLLVGGCEFDGQSAANDDGGVVLEACNEFGDRHFFDACALPGASDVVLGQDEDWRYDTDALEIIGPGSTTSLGGTLSIDTAAGTREVAVIVARSFQVPLRSSFRATGSRPLLIVSSSTIDVAGRLDVSSFFSGDSFSVGAGGVDNLCFSETTNGEARGDGSGGGGGGGFGTAGGSGGEGRSGTQGGAADPPKNLSGLAPRGGCPGGNSGAAGNMYVSSGGAAGGALLLSARDGIAISGDVLAAGAGGRGQDAAERAGGGGGGSGGFLFFEAPSLITQESARIWAYGGGGAGGADRDIVGHNGQDATVAVPNRAVGGDGHNEADGGDGSGLQNDAAAGESADRGGGGGGGGGGVIVVAAPLDALVGMIGPAPLPLATIAE